MNEPLYTNEQSRAIDQIIDRLATANRVLFITGAGMSADSGLPTYRGIGGLYNHNETVDGLSIEECLSRTVFETRPDLTWKYLGQIEQAAREASFNRGHEVIAEMEREYEVWTLTQNVDGFHILAGSKNVIEIHGTMRRLRCTCCANRLNTDSYQGLEIPPSCSECGQMMRPDVVLFEEMLPIAAQDLYQQAMDSRFDLVFSVGTTSAFPYIANPVYLAQQWGIPTVEINPGETAVSELVEYRLEMSAAVCLDEIWRRLKQKLLDEV